MEQSMQPTQPPKIPTWLLIRLGSSPNNAELLGDLAERFGHGRSPLWYWRQAAAAIVVSFLNEVWSHKLLTVWAMYIGWGTYSISRYGLILTRELLLGPRYWTTWPIWITMTVTTAETVVSGIMAGWFVALLCRQGRKAMVLAFAVSLECVPFVLLLQTMLTEQFHRFYLIAFFTLPFFTLPFFTLSLPAVGALLGGGIVHTEKTISASDGNNAIV